MNFGKGAGFGVLLAEVEALFWCIAIHSIQLSECVVELVFLAEAMSATMLDELSWIAWVCSLLDWARATVLVWVGPGCARLGSDVAHGTRLCSALQRGLGIVLRQILKLCRQGILRLEVLALVELMVEEIWVSSSGQSDVSFRILMYRRVHEIRRVSDLVLDQVVWLAPSVPAPGLRDVASDYVLLTSGLSVGAAVYLRVLRIQYVHRLDETTKALQALVVACLLRTDARVCSYCMLKSASIIATL